LLADAAERSQFARRGRADLLAELAPRGGVRRFALRDFALGDGPGAGVAVAPVGAAGVGEQDLQSVRRVPVEQEAGAGRGPDHHGRPRDAAPRRAGAFPPGFFSVAAFFATDFLATVFFLAAI